MPFSIADILKPDNSNRKNARKDSNIGSSKIFHFHDPYEELSDGGLGSYMPSFSRTSSSLNNDKNNKSEHYHNSGEVTDRPSSSTSTSASSSRKRRILFTREQTYQLQKVFRCQQYLTVPQRDYLSRKINLTPTQVKIWFQNHRYKLKKHLKECDAEIITKHSARHSPPPIPHLDSSPWLPRYSSLYVTEHSLFPRDRDHLIKLERPSTPPPPSERVISPTIDGVLPTETPSLIPHPRRSCSCPGECGYYDQDGRHLFLNPRHHSPYRSELPVLCDCTRYERSPPLSKHHGTFCGHKEK